MHVLIAGGGIGGLAAAAALLQRGIDVDVYEQATELKEVGAGIQISPNGNKVLDAIGVFQTLRELSCDSLRRNVALVSGVELVHASIRDNVRIGRTTVNDDDVRDALRRVGLLDELAVLPQGLDTELDALGHPLSEGQAQRLLIARAMAGRPRLLVIDDVLDSLPREAAREVETALFDPRSRWTLVLISNRADIAARATLVLDLPSGQVSSPSSPNAPKVA